MSAGWPDRVACSRAAEQLVALGCVGRGTSGAHRLATRGMWWRGDDVVRPPVAAVFDALAAVLRQGYIHCERRGLVVMFLTVGLALTGVPLSWSARL